MWMILEMLVVFHRPPRAAPDEAVLEEQTVTKVAFHNLIAIVLFPVNIWLGIRRLNNCLPVTIADVWVVERVDVDGEASGMIGELLGVWDITIAETTSVVVAHLSFVISVVFVSQTYVLDRVVVSIELTEDCL